MCAISGLLRVKRPHVNASRNIRPRLVVLLLRTHFCRPNELAVSSSPLCIARLPPHQDQGSCATAPPAAQVDRESCFSTRGLFPSTQEMRRSAGPAGMRSSLLCCDNSTASQDEPRLSLRLLALGCFQLVCASPPPRPPHEPPGLGLSGKDMSCVPPGRSHDMPFSCRSTPTPGAGTGLWEVFRQARCGGDHIVPGQEREWAAKPRPRSDQSSHIRPRTLLGSRRPRLVSSLGSRRGGIPEPVW